MPNDEAFLRYELVPLIRSIPADRAPVWGKMNAQQMVEHLSKDGFMVANGKNVSPATLPPDVVEKMQAFLRSEKMFRENTAHPQLPDTPLPLRHTSMDAAIEEMERELNEVFVFFENSPQATTRHFAFGDLGKEDSMRLLHKHCLHHLRQFGVAIENKF